MREIVRGYATYCLEEAISSGNLGSVITAGEALADAVESSPQLQRVFEIPDVNKRLIKEIVTEIVAKKFPNEAASLLGFLSAAEQQSQVPAVITQLVAEVNTLVRMAGASLGNQNSSLTADGFSSLYLGTFQQYTSYRQARDLMAGYMEPIFETADSIADLKIVEDFLFSAANVIRESRDLAKVLGDPYVSGEVKSGIISSLFVSKVDVLAYRVLRFAVSIPRVRDVAGLIGFCVELSVVERGKRLAEVRSVVDMSAEETAQLQNILERLIGRKIEIRFVTDPSLMGGFVVLLGDYLIDASLLTKFNQLSESLLLSA
ncbi:MAG: ATP synthase F1 subunit delta [Firmicutes bacterium]|nr:ATP synthase F1 subunit delta [Bacillota bacterium]